MKLWISTMQFHRKSMVIRPAYKPLKLIRMANVELVNQLIGASISGVLRKGFLLLIAGGCRGAKQELLLTIVNATKDHKRNLGADKKLQHIIHKGTRLWRGGNSSSSPVNRIGNSWYTCSFHPRLREFYPLGIGRCLSPSTGPDAPSMNNWKYYITIRASDLE